jgi:AcrR family transcriptional regulator
MARRAAKKTGYHHGDLRRALIDAALELVAREGPGAVSLRELAARVGVTHAAPYRHFKNKEELFATVAEEGFKMFRDALIAGRDRGGSSSREQLVQTGIAYVRFAVEHPGHFKVMFSRLGDPQSDVPGVVDEGATAFQVLVDCIIAAQAAGVLRPGDPLQQSLFAWSGVHGLSMLLVEGSLKTMGIEVPVEAHARQLSEDLIDGLTARK